MEDVESLKDLKERIKDMVDTQIPKTENPEKNILVVYYSGVGHWKEKFEQRLEIEIGGEKFDLSDIMRTVTKKRISKVVTIEYMLADLNDEVII